MPLNRHIKTTVVLEIEWDTSFMTDESVAEAIRKIEPGLKAELVTQFWSAEHSKTYRTETVLAQIKSVAHEGTR